MKKLCLLVSAVSLVAAVSPTAFAQAKVEEVVLAPFGPSSNPFFSKTGLHFAVVVPKGSKSVVSVDGVEGPRFDRLDQNLVVFSDDGLRHAYVAVTGTDAIVVLDGKEVARAPMEQGMVMLQEPKFSPSGKRFAYRHLDSVGAASRLVVDGKPGERYVFTQNLVFSPDDNRFAYLGQKIPDDGTGRLNLVVDGKDVGHQGVDPQFSPDNQTVVTVGHTPTDSVLLMNGKAGARAPSIRGVYMSSAGINLLVIGKSRGNFGGGEFLGAGGKKIEGSECEKIEWVKFSPNGKRYAALCSAGSSVKYLLIDGKKGESYAGITEFEFSPDSTRTVFLGRSNNGSYRVVDGEESAGYQAYDPVTFGAGGKHVGFIANNPGTREREVVIDGKVTKYQGAEYLAFSSDGSRQAFIGGGPMFKNLYVDGVEQKGVVVIPPINPPSNNTVAVTFSPDGKSIAHHGFVETREKEGLIVNGKVIGALRQLYYAPVFTPDSKHVFCFSMNPGGGKSFALLVDGKPAVTFDKLPHQSVGKPAFVYPAEMGTDGVFTFIGVNEGSFRRYRVTATGPL
jgi:Tol biopolymer transport system component